MHTKDSYRGISGFAELFVMHGHTRQSIGRRNCIVRTGMGVMARALAGNKWVNGMYLGYTNAAVATTPVGYDHTAGWFQSTWNSSTRGFVRVPLAAQPSYATSDATRYNENQVTFTAISNSVVTIPVAGNELQDNVSKYCMGGLCYLDPEGYSSDILFAGVAFEEPTGVDNFALTKIPNAQVGMRWTITLTTNEA